MSLLTADRLQIGYGGRALGFEVSFSISPGQMWALIGSNGSGKTTLLRTLLGLLPRVGGRVERSAGVRIGYVPQRLDLDLSIPMRCVDLVRGGLEAGRSFMDPLHLRRGREAVQRALLDADCAAFAARQFATLSEGEKQRVLLARALALDPALLVLDEPTSAMDAAAEAGAFALIDRLMRARDLGVVVVAHHLAVLARRATHLAYLDATRDLALAGETAEVSRDPRFVDHYGPLFQPGVAP